MLSQNTLVNCIKSDLPKERTLSVENENTQASFEDKVGNTVISELEKMNSNTVCEPVTMCETDPWLCLCDYCQELVKTLPKQALLVGSSNYEQKTEQEYIGWMMSALKDIEEAFGCKNKLICNIKIFRFTFSNRWILESKFTYRTTVLNKLSEFQKDDSSMSSTVQFFATIFKEFLFPKEVHVEKFSETLKLINSNSLLEDLDYKEEFYQLVLNKKDVLKSLLDEKELLVQLEQRNVSLKDIPFEKTNKENL